MDALLSANLIWTILALAALAINVLTLIHIPRERKTTAAMAWLLLIFLLPFAGMALYLLIGNFRLPKKRRDEQARITALIDERAGDQRDGRCPALVAARGPAESHAHRATGGRRLIGPADLRLSRVNRRDGRGRATWRHGAAAGRLHRIAEGPEVEGDVRRT